MPAQNDFIESFNGRFRDEFLNEVLSMSLTDARSQIATWKVEYNANRLHSALGNIPPAEFAMNLILEMLAALAQKSTQGLFQTADGRRGSGQSRARQTSTPLNRVDSTRV